MWQILDGEMLTRNYTFKNIRDLYFDYSEIIQDTLTDGIIYEVASSEDIMSGKDHSGNFLAALFSLIGILQHSHLKHMGIGEISLYPRNIHCMF
jgi:hypothetical protein